MKWVSPDALRNIFRSIMMHASDLFSSFELQLLLVVGIYSCFCKWNGEFARISEVVRYHLQCGKWFSIYMESLVSVAKMPLIELSTWRKGILLSVAVTLRMQFSDSIQADKVQHRNVIKMEITFGTPRSHVAIVIFRGCPISGVIFGVFEGLTFPPPLLEKICSFEIGFIKHRCR